MNIAYEKLEKSKGKLEIKIKNNNLSKLFQQGSLKALLPNFHENLQQLMLINTAGGITSGDNFHSKIDLDNSNICMKVFISLKSIPNLSALVKRSLILL